MPLHSAPSNSAIFAQKARERAAQVLALQGEHPGLMRGETPKPTVANRLKRHAMPIMMLMMMLVMFPMMAHMVNRNNNEAAAAANSNNNNLRANGGGDATASLENADFGDEFDDEETNEDEETSTSTSSTTYPSTEDEDEIEDEIEDEEEAAPGSPEFCVDDPDYRYFGEARHSCEWVAEQHTADRCGDPKILENCRATCHPECNGGIFGSEEEESEPQENMEQEEERNENGEEFEEEEEEDMDGEEFEEEEEDETDEEEDAISCIDDVDFRYQGVESKDCDWAFAKFTNFRCGKPEVLAACPATCSPECGTFPPTSTATSTWTSTSTSTSTSIVSISEEEMLSI